MTKPKPSNVAHSVRARLLTLSKERREEFQFVLTRYALERLLYRLSRSTHREGFVLKGAMMFAVWSGHPHRATKDLDLLGSGSPDLDRLAAVFREVVVVGVEDDGLVFDATSVVAVRIKEDADYEGVRVTLDAKLGTAKVGVQIDIGFGDAVTPSAVEVAYPSLLDLPRPSLRAYPRETVVAEKLQAMVHLGLLNSRMKDFFDLWVLATHFEFDGELLVRAVKATFERRGTPLPTEPPVALTSTFSNDGSKQKQWTAFLRRSGVGSSDLTLDAVVAGLAEFLLPVVLEPRHGLGRRWRAGGPWG